MTVAEIYEFLNCNPVFYLATVEENQPRVRGMLLFRADKDGIVFHTASTKELYTQVKKNPNVELCFNGKGKQIRITGKVEEVQDPFLRQEIFQHPSRKFLNEWKDNGIESSLSIFRLKNGTATIWTMDTNFDPKQYIQL